MATNYLLHGNEKYIINEKINEIIKDIELANGERPEILMIDDDTTLSELKHHLTYTSLFSLAQIIVVQEPFWLKGSSRKSGQNKQALEIIADYFIQNSKEQSLIVTSRELAKTNPIVKLFSQKAHIIECKDLSKAELRKWLTDKLNSKGLKADGEAINIMLNSGQDMYYLDNLLEKFALGEIENINKGQLEKELEMISQINIFRLTDALFSKNTRLAINALHHLIEQGETIGMFIGMINNQFTSFAKVKAAHEKGYNNVQIEKATGLLSFVVRNMLRNVNKFTWEELWYVFDLLLATDLKVKTTGQDNNFLMETLIINICNQ